MTDKFNGFPQEMQDFLFWLRFNNTFAAQQKNAQRYKALVTEPLMRLYETLLPTAAEICPQLETRRARCVSTPYTDRRFSPTAPLKEYMYLRFKVQSQQTDIPGLYFDLGAESYSFGLRVYKQTVAGMDELRERMSDAPQRFSDAIDNLTQCGFTVDGERYKRDHYPEMPDSSAKDLCNHKSFYAGKEFPISESVFTPALAEEIAEGFWQCGKLLRLLKGDTRA